MTPGQLIDLLEKAGMLKEESPGVLGWHPTMQKAERFAALIREHLLSNEIHSCHADCQRFACVQTRKAVEAEREACAKVCTDLAVDMTALAEWGATTCEKAIRARSNI